MNFTKTCYIISPPPKMRCRNIVLLLQVWKLSLRVIKQPKVIRTVGEFYLEPKFI